MKVQEMMHADVVTVSPDTSLAQAQRLMRDHRIRHLPVVSGQNLVGLVTDRDLRHASPSQATTLSRGEMLYQMDNLAIETCMTRDVVTIDPEDDMVQGAKRLLAGTFGCLPVVDGGKLVGMVTEIDLLQGFLAAAVPAGELMKIEDYMHAEPHTAPPDALVSAAYDRMREARIRHLPVVADDTKLVGILTDRDIRLANASTEPQLATHEWMAVLEKMTVRSIMTTRVQTISRDMPVADAGQLFLDHKFGCLPVVRDGDIVEGIVTVTDLLRAYVAQHSRS